MRINHRCPLGISDIKIYLKIGKMFQMNKVRKLLKTSLEVLTFGISVTFIGGVMVELCDRDKDCL